MTAWTKFYGTWPSEYTKRSYIPDIVSYAYTFVYLFIRMYLHIYMYLYMNILNELYTAIIETYIIYTYDHLYFTY